MNKITTTRINLWSSPRNVSTALMYSFAQRADTTVVDEPLYAHYLTRIKTEAIHPATEEILTSQENDGNKVIQNVIFGDYHTPIVFFKHMTHHLIELPFDFLTQTQNVLLIRNPIEMIASYIKVIPNPKMADIGVLGQYKLYQKLEALGQQPLVIDSKEILLNPRKILSQLTEKLGIGFDEAMLSWSLGARPEDGVWAKHWYANVHRSTGFKKYEKKSILLPENVRPLAEECLPYYEFLYEKSLKS